MKVAAIVLAAGGATRFGRPKQLLELGGENLVRRACRVAHEAGCEPVVTVLGAHAEAIQTAGLASDVRVVVNEAWQDGMGASLAAGVRALGEKDLDAVLVLLVDQPGVGANTLRVLIEKSRQPGVSIVLCDSGGATGPPALFGRRHFAALSKLEGDQGGKAVARDHPHELATVNAPETRWDIDDPDTWSEFEREIGNRLRGEPSA